MTTIAQENDVLTLIERGTELPTIEDRTGWDPDDISGLAIDNGFVFDLTTFRFYDRARTTPPPRRRTPCLTAPSSSGTSSSATSRSRRPRWTASPTSCPSSRSGSPSSASASPWR